MENILSRKKGYLLLEDGVRLNGYSFGAEVNVSGECVFSTGMVGYPESISDPSYTGQILVFSYPLIGNYGVPSYKECDPATGLPTHFESERAHVSAIIASDYTDEYSHWAAEKSLSEWLKESNIPALYGIDTRALISKIREKGSLKGKVIIQEESANQLEFVDINQRNLVAEVSTKQIKTYKATKNIKNKKVIVLDCGIKYNQIRCLVNRGVDLKVVPWDYDVVANEPVDQWDGLFISNGPGDPSVCGKAIENIRKVLALTPAKPVFGVCMGNQLLGLAAGARTHKMAFGNRGLNQPCVDQITGRCHITSQNHGFVIDTETLPAGWKAMFINANDFSNEGIYHTEKPFFSVQFHPEAMAGPTDTEYLFDNFVANVCGTEKTSPMNKSKIIEAPKNIHKVLILGSGGLSIGQAGEFDYSGSQAIKALKEEGVKTIVINPNIATVQTSPGLADKVYFLPVNYDSVVKVIENENPDGILVTFGGQTALNCGIELYKSGILEKHGVKVLGTPIDTIIATEDRGIFAQKLEEINERIAPSMACNTLEESIIQAEKIGYPVIIRAAYCLGGLGSGFANNKEQLINLVNEALATSSQVLVEKSLKGWKEIEYEVLRDSHDNCITVCNMENFDPLGIHTGESIVVAPSQTLSDREYQMLRETAIKTVRHLGVIGECNIQYALNPDNEEYCIIEVNARLSRSSALASKATGYPLAFISAKVALGFDLATLRNTITKKTTACFEPSLDYLVVKMPKWDLKKFSRVSTKISSSMKSVGEVMSIGRKFEEAIQKAIRMVMDNSVDGFQPGVCPTSDEELEYPTNNRILVLASAFKDGYTVDRVHELTKIDKWFLAKLKAIIDLENHLEAKYTNEEIPVDLLKYAKQQGFSDKQIARAIGTTELSVRNHRKRMGVIPVTKHIDTVAAEFPAQNNYLYMTYNADTNDIDINEKAYVTLGSGAYRIGSSVEFDWCAVSCIRTLRELGLKSIMINFNPETVSTDYDECDYLYFEELNLERVLDIYERGGPDSNHGVILSVGGQIPNNLAIPLSRQNVKVLGTHPDMIDNAENRYKFSRLLDSIGIDQPLWKELTSVADTKDFCETVGFPCLVRPSYVLSGAAMNVVHSAQDLENFLTEAAAVSREHPVVISKFISEAKEIEIDAVADNGEIVLFAISEHVENAGVHSGDATLVCPAQDLDDNTIAKVEETARKIAAALNVSGPFNIQFIAKNNEIKVIECNLRCSRSFPFVSKTLNVNFIEVATKIIIRQPYTVPALEQINYVGVKVPQFSFIRLKGADPVLGVEMASTGEVACFGNTREEAYIKGLISTGFKTPEQNVLLSIGPFKEKHEFLPSAKKLVQLGYTLFGTRGTADFYQENGVKITQLNWDEEELGNEKAITKKMTESTIHLFINLPSNNKYRRPSSFMSRGYSLRRIAIDFQVPLITNIKCAKLFVDSISYMRGPMALDPVDCRTSSKIVRLPGLVDVHVHLRDPGATHKEDWDSGTASALAGGFTIVGAMPNTNPAIMDQATFELAKTLSKAKARCDYGIFIGATWTNTTTAGDFANDAMGMKMYLEETFAPLPLKDDINVWRDHIMNWPAGTTPVCVHADGRNLAAILLLGWMYNKPMHVCHVSHKEEIDIIRDCKKRGMNVTCEVSPHHLTLCDKDIERIGSGQSEVRPRLGTQQDMDSLWENIDYIDMIATDHAPHTYEEKCSAKPPPGFPGLETSLPLMLTAVHQGRITLDDLVKKMHTNPMRIFGIKEQPNTYIEVNMDEEWVIPKKPEYSRCGWTPFEGLKVRGKVSKVVLRGKMVYIDGKILAEPGYGLNVRSAEYKSLSTPVEAIEVVKPVSAASPKKVKPSTTDKHHLPLVGAVNLKKEIEPETTQPDSLFQKHILSVKQFNRKQLHALFGIAHEMRILVKRSGGSDLLKGKVMANLFYEPSSRTQCSFAAAMQRLGGTVISVDSVSSSVAKGESIADTIHTLESYTDIITMRHPQVGSVNQAVSVAKHPIINAGDGVGEHPTQALLDVFTIREELGTVNGLTITLVGDLKNGRTVHSLVRVLSLYQVKLNYISPASLCMPEEIVKELAAKGIQQNQYDKFDDDVLAQTNVLYVTRIQKERFTDIEHYNQVKDQFIVTPHTLTKSNDNMIVMHPLPRINEIDPEVDSDPRAAYFRQMENGMYVRMALLASIFGKN